MQPRDGRGKKRPEVMSGDTTRAAAAAVHPLFCPNESAAPARKRPTGYPSILIGGKDLSVLERDETSQGHRIDGVLEEADTPIAHQDVHPARVIGEELVVGAGIVALGGPVL